MLNIALFTYLLISSWDSKNDYRYKAHGFRVAGNTKKVFEKLHEILDGSDVLNGDDAEEYELALKKNSALIQELETHSASNSTGEVLFAAGVITGALWLLATIGGIIYRFNRRRAMRVVESKAVATVEQEKEYTCVLLESLYDALRFQLHGLRVLLGALAGDDMLEKINDPKAEEFPEIWQPWRSMMLQVENQLLMLYNAIGGNDICKTPPMMPDLKLAAQRADSLKFPRGIVTATALLIVAGHGKIVNNLPKEEVVQLTQDREQSVEFVSRFLRYLEASSHDLPRSGPLWDPAGRKTWWTLDFLNDGLQQYPEDPTASMPLPHVLSDLRRVKRSGFEHDRPCMSLGGASIPDFRLCAEDETRLQEWMESLNFYRCNSETAQKKNTDCAEELLFFQNHRRKSQWEDLPKRPELPEAWMQLSWRQRALEAKVALDCEVTGNCKIAKIGAEPTRKSGILFWQRDPTQNSRSKSNGRKFFLLRSDSFSWYSGIRSKTPIGEIKMQHLLFDKIQMLSKPTTRGSGQLYCFEVECTKDGTKKRYSGCALTESEAMAWVRALRKAYAKFFGLHGNDKVSELDTPVKEGTLMAMIASRQRRGRVDWTEVSVSLTRHAMSIKFGNGSHSLWRLASVKTDTVKLGKMNTCVPSKSATEKAGLPLWAKCFCFDSDGILFEGGKHIFCGVEDHLDNDRKLWATVLPGVLDRFDSQDGVEDSPRDRDVTWGTHLLQNPLESPRAAIFLNELLGQLPKAQRTGQAVLCPPGCTCPLYASPMELLDVPSTPKCIVHFEVRKCNAELAQIRSVKLKLGAQLEAVLELRLRGVAVADPDANRSIDALQINGNLEGYLKNVIHSPGNVDEIVEDDADRIKVVAFAQEEPLKLAGIMVPEETDNGNCDAAELADLLRLLWRFAYHRDAEALSQRIPRQQSQDAKTLIVLVLQPLVKQYLRETRLHLPDFRFEGLDAVHSRGKCVSCHAFSSCSSTVLWQVLMQVEREELLLIEFFGSSAAQTDAERNSNFHRHALEPARAMLVAAEFWRSMNEHGCAPTELWHPLEKSCYTFCLGRKTCKTKRQKWPGDETCGYRYTHAQPSEGLCQQVCRVLLPGHPGCELGDPSKLPQAVEDFYKQTEPDAFALSKLALWDAPRTLMPAAQFFVQYPTWIYQSLQANAFMIGIDKLLGITSTTQAIAHGLTTLTGQIVTSCGIVVSLASLLWEFYGYYTTWRNYQDTKGYFQREMQERLREMRFVKCRLLSSMRHMREQLQESGDTVHGQLVTQLRKSPDLFVKLQERAGLEQLVSQMCAGPLPPEFTKASCEGIFSSASSASQSTEDFTNDFVGLLESLVEPFGGALESEVDQCGKLFPSSTHARHPVPVSSVQALWFNPLPEEEADNLVQIIRERSNQDFEPVLVDTRPGEPTSMDAKIGMTEPLQAVLLAVRDPSSPPLSELKVYHVKRPESWSSRSARSVPSQDEYDMSLLAAMNSESPVGLAPGNSCNRRDDDTQARCHQFSSYFKKHGADYSDSLRSGGFVDLSMPCDRHWTSGRNESLVFGGGEVEVLLSSRSGYELPPLTDLRLSNEPFSRELGMQGFLRVPLDINKECAAGALNSKSFLYYRREWVLRPSYAETMSEAERIEQSVRQCLDAGVVVNLGLHRSMINDRRCIRCDCQKDKAGSCHALGLLDGYIDLGLENGVMQRRRMVYVGEIFVEHQRAFMYDCEPRGIGRLWSLTQSLVKRDEAAAQDSLWSDLDSSFGDLAAFPKPPREKWDWGVDGETVSPILHLSSGDFVWQYTPEPDDFFFNGEVHRYGDVELFDHDPAVPGIKATKLICESWRTRYARLQASASLLKEFSEMEFRDCLNTQQSSSTLVDAVQSCFARQPLSSEDMEKLLPEEASGEVRSVAQSLADEYAHTFRNQIVKSDERCEKDGFVQYKPEHRLFSSKWPLRKLRLKRIVLETESCKVGKVQKMHLPSARLSLDLEVIDLHRQAFGCFTLEANDLNKRDGVDSPDGVRKSLKLCAPVDTARDWHHVIGQAMIDVLVGPFSTSLLWLFAGLKLKCAEDEALPGRSKVMLELRPLPDGFGELLKIAPSLVVAKGKFARGVQVGIGETRSIGDGGGVAVGRFHRGSLAFGTSILHKAGVQSAQARGEQVLPGFDHVLEGALFGHENLVFTGYWLETRTSGSSQRWPAHIGTIRDSQLRPLYWGQFGLWLPWGFGVWCDHDSQTMFRGVLKKEYERFSVGMPARDAQFVPLLVGELTRLQANVPISDKEVLRLGVDLLPQSLMHTSSLLMSGAVPTTPVEQKMVCRSKALFQWAEWLEHCRRLVGVWGAIADGTDFDYDGRLRVTAYNEDIYMHGRDIDQLLQAHTKQLVKFRNHLKHELSKEQEQIAEQRLNGAVEVLTDAAARSRDFDEWDSYWTDSLRDKPEMLHIARELKKLGPMAYMQFSTIASFIKACDVALDFATSSYCMLCFEKAEREEKKRWSLDSLPELSIRISHARGMLAGRFKVRVRVGQERDSPVEYATPWEEAKLGDVRWDGAEGNFDGKVQRLEAATWVQLTLIEEVDLKNRTQSIEVASWKNRLVSIIGRRGDFEWLRFDDNPELRNIGLHKTNADMSLEVRVAFSLRNTAAIFGRGSQHVLPEGCGATYAVKRLIERNELRLRRVESRVQRVESDAGDLANSAQERQFEQSLNIEATVEQFVPDPGYNPPRAMIEKSLHEDVFKGIHTTDGPSVTLYMDNPNPTKFYEGTQFFGEYVRMSNPANFHSHAAGAKQ